MTPRSSEQEAPSGDLGLGNGGRRSDSSSGKEGWLEAGRARWPAPWTVTEASWKSIGGNLAKPKDRAQSLSRPFLY